MVKRLPQPTGTAKPLVGIAHAIVESLPNVGPWLALAMRSAVDRSIVEGQRILSEEFSRRGIEALDDLTEEQREWFVPAGYRFFEQARLGEYEHNLRVLARLVAGEMLDENRKDVGRVARAARRLESISKKHLLCLACITDEISTRVDAVASSAPLTISVDAILERSAPKQISADEVLEAMQELEWRGIVSRREGEILASGRGPSVYELTAAYYDIFEAIGPEAG